MKPLTKIKFAVAPAVSCIIFAGQLFHAAILEKNYSGSSLPVFISYSLIMGLLGYFIVDFITAAGYLRRKIRFVKFLLLYFLFLILMNNSLTFNFLPASFTSEIQLLFTILVIIFIIIFDIFFKRKRDFDFVPEVKQLPGKYLRCHPFKTTLETIFRLFPLPEPVALYRVGNPDRNSPVIVSGNYELAVRRVAKALQRLDCWLLICDSRGINVWCSSLSGHFSEKNIIRAVELTHLSKYVSHKKLILPQLCAPGVDIQVIKRETGFETSFGPVYIERIKDFLDHEGNEFELRRVNFGIRQRIEMAIGSPIILSLALAFIYLFIDLSKLLFILPGLYFIALIHAVVYPCRPVKRIPLWAFLCSLGVTGLIMGILFSTRYFSFTWSIGVAITIGIGIFYLINEFEGWSPLVKYNLRSIYKGAGIPVITVNEELCTGCGLCFQVCPKGVFIIEAGRAKVPESKECMDCSACYNRCPTEAIIHSSDRGEKGKCGCVYCKIQDGLQE